MLYAHGYYCKHKILTQYVWDNNDQHRTYIDSFLYMSVASGWTCYCSITHYNERVARRYRQYMELRKTITYLIGASVV